MGRIVFNGEILGGIGVSSTPAYLELQLTNLNSHIFKKITRIKLVFENLTSDLDIDLHHSRAFTETPNTKSFSFTGDDLRLLLRTEYFGLRIEDDSRQTPWRLSSIVFYGGGSGYDNTPRS